MNETISTVALVVIVGLLWAILNRLQSIETVFRDRLTDQPVPDDEPQS